MPQHECLEVICRHCWVDSEAIQNGWGPKSFCPPDEHYIPTLLASKGLDNETDCTVSMPLAQPLSIAEETDCTVSMPLALPLSIAEHHFQPVAAQVQKNTSRVHPCVRAPCGLHHSCEQCMIQCAGLRNFSLVGWAIPTPEGVCDSGNQ